MGRLLITLGIIFVLAGILVLAGVNLKVLGRLPGDFTLRRGNLTLYVPLTTAFLISLLLTIVLNAVWKR